MSGQTFKTAKDTLDPKKLLAAHSAAAGAADAASLESAKKQTKGMSRDDAARFMLNEWVGLTIRVLRAIADGTRLRLIALLAEKSPRTVGDLAKELEVRSSTMSQHIAMLRDARVVFLRKRGLFTEVHLNCFYLEEKLNDIASKVVKGYL